MRVRLVCLTFFVAAACGAPPDDADPGMDGQELLGSSGTSLTTPVFTLSNTGEASNGNSASVALGPLPRGTSLGINGCSTRTSGNAIFKLVDAQGRVRATGAPGGCGAGRGPLFSTTVPETGEYTLRIGCRGSESCTATAIVYTSTALAERWAPAVYQDTWPGYLWLAGYTWERGDDYLTKVNFDGDYYSGNNSVNRKRYGKPAFIYYSKMETETHHFVGYYFYHPQDAAHTFDNDLEGVLFSIRKVGLFGRLEGWVSQVHGEHWTARDAAAIAPCSPIFGGAAVTWHEGRVNEQPAVYIEPRGHGVKTCLQGDCGNNDGVVYLYEGGKVETPGVTSTRECGDGGATMRDRANNPTCGYGLIAMEETGGRQPAADGRVDQGLWHLRRHRGLFLNAVDWVGLEANTPWRWNHNWLAKPAELLKTRQWDIFVGNGCNVRNNSLRYVGAQPYIDDL